MSEMLRDLAVVLLLSLASGAVLRYLRLPPSLGYIIAGILAGPYAMEMVEDLDAVSEFADIGLILLMFTLGLEFNLRRLRSAGVLAIAASLSGTLLLLGTGYAAGMAMGLESMDAVFLGAALSIGSTAIVLRMLRDLAMLHTRQAEMMIAILVVEDISAVVLLTLLSGISMLTPSIGALAEVVLRIAGFFTLVYLLGVKAVPVLMRRLNALGGEEMLFVASLAMCFSLAFFAQKLGLSLALGAFVMGAVIAESRLSEQVLRNIAPVRDLFVMLFFVSIGMLIDLRAAIGFLPQALALLLMLAGLKLLTRGGLCFLGGMRGKEAVAVGLGLLPMGEFSLAMVKLGYDQGVVSQKLYPLLGALVVLSVFSTPLLLKRSDSLAGVLAKLAPASLKEAAAYMSSLFSEPGGTRERGEVRRKMLYLVVCSGALFGALRLATALSRGMEPELRAAVALLFAAPVLWLMLSQLSGVAELLTEAAGRRFLPGEREAAREALRRMLLLTLLAFLSLFMMPTLAGYFPELSDAVPVLVLLLLLLLSMLYWQTLISLHERIYRLLQSLRGGEKPASLLAELAAGGSIGEVVVEEGSDACGRSIAELRIRELTGATVLAVVRGERTITNPSPEERLMAGDVLLVFGSAEARRRLGRLVSRQRG